MKKTNTKNALFIQKNFNAFLDMVWQGLKYTMEEMKSSASYGDGSPTNKLLRNHYLAGVLENGFYNFYRMADYSHENAVILSMNAMKIWKEQNKKSVSDINMSLLMENMFLAEATIAKAKKQKTK